jgi:hypothetical protein
MPNPQAKMQTHDAALQEAVDHHQSGRLAEADRLYRGILAADPDYADANHSLGILALQSRQIDTSISHLRRALDRNPTHPHDCLPLETPVAERQPNAESVEPHRQGMWTGDVWRTALLLKRYRPDLRLIALDAVPTGLVLVTHLDPRSTLLANHYDSLLTEMMGWSLIEITLAGYTSKSASKPRYFSAACAIASNGCRSAIPQPWPKASPKPFGTCGGPGAVRSDHLSKLAISLWLLVALTEAVPTWPICCWLAPQREIGNSLFAWPSAPAGRGSFASCWWKACFWRSPETPGICASLPRGSHTAANVLPKRDLAAVSIAVLHVTR